MKQRILLLFYIFSAWTIFFLVARVLFLLYHANVSSTLSWSEIFLTFVHGIRMDFSMAGYLSLLPGLMLAILFFVGGIVIWRFLFVYHMVLLLIVSFIVVLDFELYKHWGFRLDATPLMYMGKEAAGSGDFWTTVLLTIFWLSIYAASIFLFRRVFRKRTKQLLQASWVNFPLVLLITASLIIPIRGSFGVAPMNTGFVYFHKSNIFANHAAVNVVWNFAYAVQKMTKLRYADTFFDEKKTRQHFADMYVVPDSSISLLRTKRPNVMVIVLESYTSRFIAALGGLPGVAPRFDSLVKEGVLFDNFYASGDRTDKGIVSILNGYPAQPVTSIIKDPKKTSSLPYLSKVFKNLGYHTEFTYGYNIDYANFRSYLIHAGFDHVTHSMHFPQELNTSKWGVHDQYVFQKFFEETQKCKTPFFKIMMTQSSHEPFDVPMKTVIEGSDDVHRFLNSAYYADKCFGEFIDKAKLSAWWENTLIVVTADHGHYMPDNNGIFNYKRFKIPMLWLGGALAVRDTVVHTVGCQTDIPNTILGQVGLFEKEFMFSHDLCAKNNDPMAMFIFNNGFGMVTPDALMVYDNVAERPVVEEGRIGEKHIENAKAFMQMLYWDFNSR